MQLWHFRRVVYGRQNEFGLNQGGCLREKNMKFDPAWEKPVKAILDHYRIDDVTIIGASLFHEEYDLLPNVRSLALQLYSNADDAGSHCNMGNMKLVLDTMISWIELINGKNGEK